MNKKKAQASPYSPTGLRQPPTSYGKPALKAQALWEVGKDSNNITIPFRSNLSLFEVAVRRRIMSKIKYIPVSFKGITMQK